MLSVVLTMYSSFYPSFKFHFITLCFVLVVCVPWRPCATDEGRLGK